MVALSFTWGYRSSRQGEKAQTAPALLGSFPRVSFLSLLMKCHLPEVFLDPAIKIYSVPPPYSLPQSCFLPGTDHNL